MVVDLWIEVVVEMVMFVIGNVIMVAEVHRCCVIDGV